MVGDHHPQILNKTLKKYVISLQKYSETSKLVMTTIKLSPELLNCPSTSFLSGRTKRTPKTTPELIISSPQLTFWLISPRLKSLSLMITIYGPSRCVKGVSITSPPPLYLPTGPHISSTHSPANCEYYVSVNLAVKRRLSSQRSAITNNPSIRPVSRQASGVTTLSKINKFGTKEGRSAREWNAFPQFNDF